MDRRQLSNKTHNVQEYILEGYNNGMTLTELAVAYNISISTVRNVLVRNNVPRRKKGPNKKGA